VAFMLHASCFALHDRVSLHCALHARNQPSTFSLSGCCVFVGAIVLLRFRLCYHVAALSCCRAFVCVGVTAPKPPYPLFLFPFHVVPGVYRLCTHNGSP
jgi:hypothetical protein